MISQTSVFSFSTLCLGLFFSVCRAQVNLLSNTQFDSGKTKWFLAKYSGVVATFSIDTSSRLSGTHCAVVVSEKSTESRSDLKFFQDIEITANRVYDVYFMAKTETEREIDMVIENDVEEYAKWPVILSPDKKHYGPIVFESAANDFLSYFSFHVGGMAGVLLIDSVVVHERLPTALFENVVAEVQKPVFQTPGNGQLTIELAEPVAKYGEILVSDISGKKVTNRSLAPNASEVSIMNLSTGAYLLHMRVDDWALEERIVVW